MSQHSQRHRREQALELLRRGWPPGDEPRYDPDHALMLCRMAGFKPGLIFLYENLRLFREVLQVGTSCSCLQVELVGRCMAGSSQLPASPLHLVLSCITVTADAVRPLGKVMRG